MYAVPRSLVARVEPRRRRAPRGPRRAPEPASGSPPATPPEALRFARLALFREPGSVPALQALAAAQLALGDVDRAREAADAAPSALEPGNPRSLELLGDALAEGGRLRRRPRAVPDVAGGGRGAPRARASSTALGSSAASVSSARFRIRYDGAADEPLGLAVLRVLDAAWEEYEKRLGFAPGLPVDGRAADRDQLPRHDPRARLGGGLERRHDPRAGDGPRAADARPRARPPPRARPLVRGRARRRQLPHLAPRGPRAVARGRRPRSRGPGPRAAGARARPFPASSRSSRRSWGSPRRRPPVAYAQSLSAVAHLLRKGGEAGLRRLIEALGRGQPAAEALPTAFSLSYAELQRDWEAHLRRGGPRLVKSVRGAGL